MHQKTAKSTQGKCEEVDLAPVRDNFRNGNLFGTLHVVQEIQGKQSSKEDDRRNS
jgi:hypothetical protein